MPDALLNDPIRDPVINRRTLNRLPTLEGARCHGPGFGVPGVLSPLTSEALGLLLGLINMGRRAERNGG